MKNAIQKYVNTMIFNVADDNGTSSPIESAAAAEAVADSSSPADDNGGDSGADESDVDTGTAATAESTPENNKGKPETKSEDWRDRKIAKLTAKLREERQAKPATPPATPNEPLDPTEDFYRRVNEAAAAQLAVKEFNAKCEDVAKQGKEKFGDDFTSNLKNVQRLYNDNDPKEVQNYFRLIQAAMDVGDAHELLYALGDDLDLAEKIIDMSDTKMAVELTKLHSKVTAPAPAEEVSQLAKPITTVGGRTGDRNPIDPADPRSDQLSTAEWMKRRNAAIASGNGRSR